MEDGANGVMFAGSPLALNLPSLGPKRITPAKAAEPPQAWTNVDPAKYAELVAERDRLLAERDELAAAIAAMKGDNDSLVDKVVETEAERDDYKKQLDEIKAIIS